MPGTSNRVPVIPAGVHKDIDCNGFSTNYDRAIACGNCGRPHTAGRERVTAPAISDSHIASAIKGGVLCAVEVTLAIERYVVARTKLVGVSKTINVSVPCPFTRHSYRDSPQRHVAHETLVSSGSIPLTHSFVPGEVSLAEL